MRAAMHYPSAAAFSASRLPRNRSDRTRRIIDDWIVSIALSALMNACFRWLSLATLTSIMALAPVIASAQADYAREKRWADEVTPAILVGDPVYLVLKSGHKFLAIWAPNPKATAGVIVVHGLGVHPDWGLINLVRSQLADQGYATLSVQMPVLAADARAEQYPPLFPEAAERIAAAVTFLRG